MVAGDFLPGSDPRACRPGRRHGRWGDWRVAACALLAVVGGTASSTANAQLKPQIQTGSLIPVKPTSVDPKTAAVVKKNFARCVYAKAPAKAQLLLEHSDMLGVNTYGTSLTDYNKDFGMENCLSKQVGDNQDALGYKFSPLILRDLMAEEAYLAKNKVAPTLPAEPTPLAATYVSVGDALPRATAITAFVDCVVLRDVAHADALLRTVPASNAEHDAAAALAPALGACLTQGQSMVLHADGVRSMIAFGMWNRFGREGPHA